ncbi:MAG: GMP/IMP nucleotidase [Proteobacteria bacterium]|nr:GMP/IMP nucleotidase [Pseudomonadota bacterium]MBU1714166.1 GMP/IMP nucleotidase [Pseudomonadota bacterium]
MSENIISVSIVDWDKIDTVLLDMDGTLLDRNFDDYFWEYYVPEVFAGKNNITFNEARNKLLSKYKSREKTLEWTDLDFWSVELDLDIPAMKIELNHLIDVHPYVVDFLDYCRKKGKNIILVTNAHQKTLEIKMKRTSLAGHFDQIVCSAEVGLAKEDPNFWPRLEKMIGFSREKTMLVDDTEAVLDSARQYGMGSLFYVARPSSTREVCRSNVYTSIIYFNELIID